MKTTAKVVVTLEIPVRSGWGSDCGMDQVFRQAKDEATETIRHHFNIGDGLVAGMPCEQAQLHATITNMRVLAIIMDNEGERR